MQGRILITGGAGFIGSHLASRLVNDGHDVHVLARPQTSLQRLLPLDGSISVHRVDLTDETAVTRVIDAVRPSRVFHLAASTRPDPAASPAVVAKNASLEVSNLLILLRALCQHPPAILVRAGSIAEYGTAPLPYREDGPEQPVTPYGKAMAAGTDCLRRMDSLLPFPVVTARLALVYGPHQSAGFMVPAMIRACLREQDFAIRHPDDERDLVYVDDVVDCLLRMSVSRHESAIVNIGSGAAISMQAVAEQILQASNGNPATVSYGAARPAAERSILIASCERAEQLYGWQAETSFSEGLRKTIAHERELILSEAC